MVNDLVLDDSAHYLGLAGASHFLNDLPVAMFKCEKLLVKSGLALGK